MSGRLVLGCEPLGVKLHGVGEEVGVPLDAQDGNHDGSSFLNRDLCAWDDVLFCADSEDNRKRGVLP